MPVLSGREFPVSAVRTLDVSRHPSQIASNGHTKVPGSGAIRHQLGKRTRGRPLVAAGADVAGLVDAAFDLYSNLVTPSFSI